MQFNPCFFAVERTLQVYSASRFLFKTHTVNVFSFLTLYDVRLDLSFGIRFISMCHDIKNLTVLVQFNA